MRRIIIMACALALLPAAAEAATTDEKYAGSPRDDHHARPSWWGKPHYYQRATIYGTPECDANSPSYHTADGTDVRSGRRILASNRFRMHTLIRFDRPLFGYRYYRVRDTGGGGSALLDVFHACPLPRWDNPTLGFRVVG